MLPEIEKLLVLQDRDRKIRALKQELKLAPLERKELDEKLAEALKKFEAVKLKAKEIEVERKKLEVEVQAKRDSINKFQTQKFQTRKNEEFQALNNEIKRYEGDISSIEDRELELMESGDKAKTTIAETDKETQAVKTQVERQLADIAGKIDAVGVQLKELEAERARLAENVDEDLLDTFNGLFSTKSEAVVALEHGVCMGCHMTLTTQTMVRVKGNREIVNCEQCGRILYPGEE
ncbi:MAG: C4-type zinc ribbon domain-containing protein [Chthoniobacter sp.]|uniref:zinc ribbon domain-containing protein n=1 Tax=Chthoniobacter sp. TaxID=2510640 RepID=UPI0032A40C7A